MDACEEEGLSGTSPVVTQSGGVTNAVKRRGVVVAVT
jgi:hypothetical protein